MTNQVGVQGSSFEILIGRSPKGGKAVTFSSPEDDTQEDYARGAASKSQVVDPSFFPSTYYVSRSELFLLSFFNFPYGLICGTMALCILPAEAARLTPLFQSWTLGFFLGLVGLSQLVCPLVGRISDQYEARSPFGQRMPFFTLGAVLAVVSTLIMWLSSLNLSLVAFSGTLLTGMCGLNICSSIQTGLIPSFVDAKRSGEASGVGAIGTLAGASTGFGIIAVCNRFDFHFVYPLYGTLLIVALAVTMSICSTLDSRLYTCLMETALDNTPRDGTMVDDKQQLDPMIDPEGGHDEDEMIPITSDPGALPSPPGAMGGGNYRFDDIFLSQRKLANSIDLHALLYSYYLPLNDQTRDFFWVFVGRTMYYVAVSVQAFILFYLRDVVHTPDEAGRMTQVGIMALTAQACAAVVAYPLGRSIDNVGISRKLLIYAACAVMSLCYSMLAAAPVFGPHAFNFVWFPAVVYGIGNGCFLAVDYAIALTTLPDKSKAAQSLGIWGLSAFVGSALGPLLWGFAVQMMGSDLRHRGQTEAVYYSYWGYLCMLIGGILATAASALCVATLRSVK